MIVFGSRGSDLAMTQTRMVAELVKRATGEDYRIEVMVTTGDRIQDRPLSGIGVKGLFTRELEDALRSGAIDAAVHSLKDLPVEQPEGIRLGAVPPRERSADVLVARPGVLDGAGSEHDVLQRLATGARVGTSSPRRAMALACATQASTQLQPVDIRGNVPTRVDKVRRGDYDAVLLASAGLRRLGLQLDDLVARELPPTLFPPAPGQGALGVQCRDGDARMLAALQNVHDTTTARCVAAERAVLLGLGGGCSMPLGVLVEPLATGRFRMIAGLFGGEPAAALQHASLGHDPEELAEELVQRWRPLIGDPLRGRRIAVVRPDGDRTGLAAALAVAGADVQCLSWTRTESIAPPATTMLQAIADDALVFTSPRAVRGFARACRDHGGTPFARRCFAVGDSTATELVRHGAVDVTASDGRGGAALAELLARSDLAPGARLVWPCAERNHDALPERAAEAGLTLERLPIYRLHDVEPDPAESPTVDAALFPSPSSVRAWLRRRPDDRRMLDAVAIGATTRQALIENGFERVRVLERPTPAAAVAAFCAPAR